MSTSVKSLALLALCALLWLPGVFSLPVVDRDEARYAQASRQMIESGDYIDIRFQTEARHKKPAGIYWLQAASVQVASVFVPDAQAAIWPYRLPSLLAAIAAVLMTARLAAACFGPAFFLLAGGLLASCFLLGVGARLATTDAALLASVVLAQWQLGRAYISAAGQGARSGGAADAAAAMSAPTALQAALFWLALAAGVLIKGPVILAVVGLTVLSLSVLQRSPRWLMALRPGWGLPLCLALLLPWFVAISLRSEGSFWVDSLQRDILAKAASVQEAHGAPPGAYFLSTALTFWPWTALLLPALWLAWQRRQQAAVQFCLAWALPAWLLFELLPTKLPHYVLPLFPPLLLLVALALHDWSALPLRLRQITLGLLAALAGSVGLGLAWLPTALKEGLSLPLLLAALAVLTALGWAGWRGWRVRPGQLSSKLVDAPAACAVAASLVLYQTTFWLWTLSPLAAPWLSRSAAVLLATQPNTCPGPVLSAGYEEPSLVFTLGTGTLLGAQHVPTLAAGQCHWLLVEAQALPAVQGQINTVFGPRPLQAVGSISGFNYSSNRQLKLTLYRLDLTRTG